MCSLYVAIILLGKKSQERERERERERDRDRERERERERERARERERVRQRESEKRRRWMKVVRLTFSLMIPSTFLFFYPKSRKGREERV